MTQTPQPGTSLQRLILDRKGDRSYDHVSQGCGGVPSRNVIQKLTDPRDQGVPRPGDAHRSAARPVGDPRQSQVPPDDEDDA